MTCGIDKRVYSCNFDMRNRSSIDSIGNSYCTCLLSSNMVTKLYRIPSNIFKYSIITVGKIFMITYFNSMCGAECIVDKKIITSSGTSGLISNVLDPILLSKVMVTACKTINKREDITFWLFPLYCNTYNS